MSLELLLRAGGWAALGAAVYGLLVALPAVARMAAGGRVFRADRRGQALAVGLMLAALQCASDAAFDGPTLVLATILFAWALALRLTDYVERLRPLRMVAVAVLLGLWALFITEPPLASMKVPFAAEVAALGFAGWVVSWVWLVLFGSLFARAGTTVGVAPGLSIISGLTFLALGVMRPDLMPAHGVAFAAALTGAGLGLAPLERYLFHRSTSAGAYAVGVAVGWVAAACLVKNTALLALLLPLLVLGMPLFAAVAPAAAQRRRRVIERPGHLHEVLLAQGYSQRQVAGVELVGAGYLALLAVLLVAVIELNWAIKLGLVAVWVLAGVFLGYVAVRLLPRALAHHVGPAELRLFGLRLHALTMAEALELARGFLRSGEPHYIVTCDATGLLRAREDEEFRLIVNAADLVTADGAGVVLAAKLLGLPVEVRVSGCDMVEGLCRVAAEEGETVFFLGAEPGVAEEAARRLVERTPGLKVAGCRDGYFKPEDEAAVVAELAALRPGVLFVALGQPRQERFIRAHLADIGARVAIGIGGSLDVISGRKRRAPVWMQRVGLEWAYRAAKEPSRLPRLKVLPRVVLMAFGELLRGPQTPPDEESDRP
jgi:N-acetylglucosaminyldiphosphoundecaprenol N-acetyl-beta-D-mannosaminyltransferase